MSSTLYRRGVVSKSILRIIALLVLGTAGATAEEMASPPSQFVIKGSFPISPWTGFYAGINGSYAWGNSSVTFAPNDPAAQSGTCGAGGTPKGQCIPSQDFRRDGPASRRRVRIHLAVQFALAGRRRSRLSVGPFYRLGECTVPSRQCRQHQHGGVPESRFVRDGSRADGCILLPALVLYGTGGFAYGEVNESLNVPPGRERHRRCHRLGGFSYSCIAGGGPCFSGSSSKILPGWTAAPVPITRSPAISSSGPRFCTCILNTKQQRRCRATGVANPASFTASFSPVYFATARFGLYWRF